MPPLNMPRIKLLLWHCYVTAIECSLMEDTASLFWLNLTFNFRERQQRSPTELALTFQRKTLSLKISSHAALFLKLKNPNDLKLPSILGVLEIRFRFLSNTGMLEVITWSSSNETFKIWTTKRMKICWRHFKSEEGLAVIATWGPAASLPCAFFPGAFILKWKHFQKTNGPSEPTRPKQEQLGIPPSRTSNVPFLGLDGAHRQQRRAEVTEATF